MKAALASRCNVTDAAPQFIQMYGIGHQHFLHTYQGKLRWRGPDKKKKTLSTLYTSNESQVLFCVFRNKINAVKSFVREPII
jgi:hypothetical protein